MTNQHFFSHHRSHSVEETRMNGPARTSQPATSASPPPPSHNNTTNNYHHNDNNNNNNASLETLNTLTAFINARQNEDNVKVEQVAQYVQRLNFDIGKVDMNEATRILNGNIPATNTRAVTNTLAKPPLLSAQSELISTPSVPAALGSSSLSPPLTPVLTEAGSVAKSQSTPPLTHPSIQLGSARQIVAALRVLYEDLAEEQSAPHMCTSAYPTSDDALPYGTTKEQTERSYEFNSFSRTHRRLPASMYHQHQRHQHRPLINLQHRPRM